MTGKRKGRSAAKMDQRGEGNGVEEAVQQCIRAGKKEKQRHVTAFLVCVCVDMLDDIVLKNVREALVKFSSRLMMSKAHPLHDESSIDLVRLGLYKMNTSPGCLAELLDPEEYSLPKFHNACDGLTHQLEESSSDCDKQQSFLGSILSLLQKGFANGTENRRDIRFATKVLCIASNEAWSNATRNDSLEGFLEKSSSHLVEVDMIELRCPLHKQSYAGAPDGPSTMSEVTSCYETASFISVDVVHSESIYFIFNQYISQAFKRCMSEVKLCLSVPLGSSGHEARPIECLLSPIVAQLEMQPKYIKGVCSCHNIPSVPLELWRDGFAKCALTNQFVPFQDGSTLVQVGHTLWDASRLSGRQFGIASNSRTKCMQLAFTIHSRMNMDNLNESYLHGLPYLLTHNILGTFDDFESASNRWATFVTCLRSRKECLIASAYHDFDRDQCSLMPLHYILIPDATAEAILVKRVATSEELLILENFNDSNTTVSGDNSIDCTSSMHGCLDNLELCSDVSDLSLEIDKHISLLVRHMDGVPFPTLCPEPAQEPRKPGAGRSNLPLLRKFRKTTPGSAPRSAPFPK